MPSKKSFVLAKKAASYGHGHGGVVSLHSKHAFAAPTAVIASDNAATNSIYYVEPQPGYSGPTFDVRSLHLSCTSDPYEPSAPFGCFVLYGTVEGTPLQLNGHNIHPGYIVIKQTDTEAFKRASVGAQGQVHGAVFRLAFHMDLPNNVVGEGFACINGAFKYQSATFNAKSDIYSDHDPTMSAPAIDSIKRYLVREWMKINPAVQGGGGGGGGCYMI